MIILLELNYKKFHNTK